MDIKNKKRYYTGVWVNASVITSKKSSKNYIPAIVRCRDVVDRQRREIDYLQNRSLPQSPYKPLFFISLLTNIVLSMYVFGR